MVVRFLNICVIAGLVLAAAYVYDIKYQSTLRAERVAKLQHDVRRERDVIASLRAEWARLGNPRRIQTLADRHLSLKRVEASQFVNFESLPERPPQIVQPPSEDPIGAMLDDPADDGNLTGSVTGNPVAVKGDRQ